MNTHLETSINDLEGSPDRLNKDYESSNIESHEEVEAEVEEKVEELTPIQMRKMYCQRFIKVLIVCAMISLVVYSAINWEEIMAAVDVIAQHVDKNPIVTTFIFILFIAFCNVALLPTNMLFLPIGLIYTKVYKDKTKGFLIASSISFIGMMLGIGCAFAISRKCMRSRVVKMLDKNQKNKAWVRKVKILGNVKLSFWQSVLVVVLLRVIMVPPALMNYIIGSMTEIEFLQYMIGSIACILKVLVNTYNASNMYDALENENQSDLDNIVFVAQIILTIAVTVTISYKSKKFVDKKVAEIELQE